MPGRLCIYDDSEFLKDISTIIPNFQNNIGTLHKRYNISPTIAVPIFLNNYVYTYAHFGLINSWSKSKTSFNINARSETIFEKSSFRESFKTRRGLIPINGYFEWIKEQITKESQAYMIKSSRKSYLALPCIWDEWYENSTNSYILSTSLITMEPNSKIKPIHKRMPVILDKKDWKKWLNTNSTIGELNNLFQIYPDKQIDIQKVSKAVNSVKNDSKECILEVNKNSDIQFKLF
ncbi:MAG: SOS response-associated peptidase [Campylobacterota bacterium]|nr:SOS response-associated peptidase [Campylobacterota bacterium]